MRRVLLFVVAALLLAGLIGAGGAQGRPDLSFGEGGVLRVAGPPAPSGWTSRDPAAVYPASDGKYFVAAYQAPCSGCAPELWISEFAADGTLQTGFGGGRGYELPQRGEFGPMPVATAVGPSGRLVYAQIRGSAGGPQELVVQRITSAGGLDGAFGIDGSATIPCPEKCGEVSLIPGADESVIVAVREYGGPSYLAPELTKPFLRLVELNAYGLPTKRFGVPPAMRISSRVAFEYATRTRGGGLYYGGWNSVERTSAKGRKDTKFAHNAAIALRRLERYKGGFGIKSMVVAPDGKIELFGWAGPTAGFELRLRPNGKLDAGFGKEGVQRLQFAVPDAVRGSGGATMVLGTDEYGTGTPVPVVYRIVEDGRIDPGFGRAGEQLPGAKANESGYELAPAGKGRVSVINLGLHFCRQECPAEPKIYRFLEGK